MSDEAENELILDQKEDILRLVSHIFHSIKDQKTSLLNS